MKLQFSTKYVKDFAEYVFNRLIQFYGWEAISELLIDGIGEHEKSIKIPQYQIKLSNIFLVKNSPATDLELKKGGKQLRYNSYTTFQREDLYCYFSTQWGFKGKGLNLDLVNLQRLVNEYFNDSFKVTITDKPKKNYLFEEVLSEKSISTPLFEVKPNLIFYGAPGTGKSYKIETEILKGVPETQKERVTFHPDYDNASFVGSYMPSSDDDGNIRYEFVPQVFTKIYVEAWQNPEKPYYLVIEEINRGNCAEIFGDIFQLLDRKSNYAITPKSALQSYLKKTLGDSDGIKNGKMILPPNLQLLATMNTSDQSLFPMDSAFKRRWTWKYVPIDYNNNEDENPSVGFYVKLSENQIFSWLEFIEKVNDKIKNNENLGEDKCIGNYFIKPDNKEILLEEFINKAIFYLWIDVFQEEEETPFESGTTYSDFFPEATKGKELVEKMLSKLDVSINNLAEATETTEA